MMNTIRNKLSSNVFLILIIFLISLSLSFLKYFQAGKIYPDVMGDEILYLYGSLMVRSSLSFSPDWSILPYYQYAPLYSIILSLFMFNKDMVQFYPHALVINDFILIFVPLLLSFFVYKLTNNCILSIITFVLILISPSVTGNSIHLMSEALFLPLFTLLAVVLLSSKNLSPKNIIIYILLSVLLILTKKLAIGIALGLPVALLIKHYNCKKKVFFVSLLIVLTSLGTMYFINSILGLSGQQTIELYAKKITISWNSIWIFLKSMIRQIAYLHFASALLFPLALFGAYSLYRKGDNSFIALLVCMFLMLIPGLIHIVVYTFLPHPVSKYNMFGRYADWAIPIIIFMGIIGIFEACNKKSEQNKLPFLPLILVTISILLSFTVPHRIIGFNINNMGVSWLAFHKVLLNLVGLQINFQGMDMICTELLAKFRAYIITPMSVLFCVLPFLKIKTFYKVLPLLICYLFIQSASLSVIKQDSIYYSKYFYRLFSTTINFDEIKDKSKKIYIQKIDITSSNYEYFYLALFYLGNQLTPHKKDTNKFIELTDDRLNIYDI